MALQGSEFASRANTWAAGTNAEQLCGSKRFRYIDGFMDGIMDGIMDGWMEQPEFCFMVGNRVAMPMISIFATPTVPRCSPCRAAYLRPATEEVVALNRCEVHGPHCSACGGWLKWLVVRSEQNQGRHSFEQGWIQEKVLLGLSTFLLHCSHSQTLTELVLNQIQIHQSWLTHAIFHINRLPTCSARKSALVQPVLESQRYRVRSWNKSHWSWRVVRIKAAKCSFSLLNTIWPYGNEHVPRNVASFNKFSPFPHFSMGVKNHLDPSGWCCSSLLYPAALPPGVIVEAHLNTLQLGHLGGRRQRCWSLLGPVTDKWTAWKLVRNGDLMWLPGFYTRNLIAH